MFPATPTSPERCPVCGGNPRMCEHCRFVPEQPRPAEVVEPAKTDSEGGEAD